MMTKETRQKHFNTVAEHLLKQNAKAFAAFRCAYRTPDGKKCAFGVLIPDELYSNKLEGRIVSMDCHIFGPIFTHLKADAGSWDDVRFFRKLQCIHDECDPIRWKEDLKEFAVNWALGLPECLQ